MFENLANLGDRLGKLEARLADPQSSVIASRLSADWTGNMAILLPGFHWFLGWQKPWRRRFEAGGIGREKPGQGFPAGKKGGQ